MTDIGVNTETAEPAVNENLIFIPLGEGDNAPKLEIDLAQIPANIRLQLLKTKVIYDVKNRLTSTAARHKAAMEPFIAYDNAVAADPLQTAVAAPTVERPVLDLTTAARQAREDLYSGKVRGSGTGQRGRQAVDPLVKAVTDVVVREVFNKGKAEGKAGWTFITAKAEVGSNGIEYLDSRIETLVTAGGDRVALEKMKEERYLKPARILIGADQNKAIKDGPSLL